MATLIVSIKFNDDVFFNNEFYSKVAGISCLEINNLEKEFLKMIDFNIHIEDEEFEKYKDSAVCPCVHQVSLMCNCLKTLNSAA